MIFRANKIKICERRNHQISEFLVLTDFEHSIKHSLPPIERFKIKKSLGNEALYSIFIIDPSLSPSQNIHFFRCKCEMSILKVVKRKKRISATRQSTFRDRTTTVNRNKPALWDKPTGWRDQEHNSENKNQLGQFNAVEDKLLEILALSYLPVPQQELFSALWSKAMCTPKPHVLVKVTVPMIFMLVN